MALIAPCCNRERSGSAWSANALPGMGSVCISSRIRAYPHNVTIRDPAGTMPRFAAIIATLWLLVVAPARAAVNDIFPLDGMAAAPGTWNLTSYLYSRGQDGVYRHDHRVAERGVQSW